MSTQAKIRIISIGLGLAVAAFFGYLANIGRIARIRPKYSVVVVGAIKDPRSFASQALRGVTLAYYSGSYQTLFDLDSLDTSAALSQRALQDALLGKLARRHVLAILSCQNSPEVPQTLTVARAFRIPTILLVATNKSLDQDMEGGLFLRMPPSDAIQAATLAQEADSTSAVLYENNNYGSGLAVDIIELLRERGFSPLSFALDPGAEEFGILQEIAIHNLRSVFYLGYASRVDEVLSKLQLVKYQGRLILSDGCYPGPRLTYPDIHVSLCFPAAEDDSLSEDLAGFGTYGHDCIRLLGETLRAPPHGVVDPSNLVASMVHVAEHNLHGERAHLIMGYRFSERGENIQGKFRVFTPADNQRRGF